MKSHIVTAVFAENYFVWITTKTVTADASSPPGRVNNEDCFVPKRLSKRRAGLYGNQ
jgi:hypothetical protein